MATTKKRRRGTAIVDTNDGILVAAGSNGIFLLPGGGAEKKETRIEAAMRELREETGLKTYYVKYLFRYVGKEHKSHGEGYFRDFHTVCLIKASGNPTPHHEVKNIAYYKPGSHIRISTDTHAILNKYYSYQKQGVLNKARTSIFSRFLEWLDF